MRSPRGIGALLWLLGLQVSCAGCTISIQPAWRVGAPTVVQTTPGPVAAPAVVPSGAVLPNGAVPAPVQPPVPGAPPLSPGEQVSLLAQKLTVSEDERKALAARLQQVEITLRDKNQTVVQASYEVQESTRQMKKTREDLTRWRKEMDDLRAKFKTMERENRATLETILKTLEQNIAERQHDRPSATAPTLAPLPDHGRAEKH